MSPPVLVCQGFQRAFIEVNSPIFSVSATVRRAVCERLLRNARTAGWTLVHSYLVFDSIPGALSDTIDGFSPSPREPYFRQATLSAFGLAGFQSKVETSTGSPIFLISLAGLGAIAATFLEAFQRRLPMHIVGDAVADVAHGGVSEEERLIAIETIARAHGRHVVSSDLFGASWMGLQSLPLMEAH